MSFLDLNYVAAVLTGASAGFPAVAAITVSQWFPRFCYDYKIEATALALDAETVRVPEVELKLHTLRGHDRIGHKVVVCEHLGNAAVQVREWIRTLGLFSSAVFTFFLLAHVSQLHEPASTATTGTLIFSVGTLICLFAIAESFRKEVLIYSSLFIATSETRSNGARGPSSRWNWNWRWTFMDLKNIRVGDNAHTGDITGGDKVQGDKVGGNKIVQTTTGDGSPANLSDVLNRLEPAVEAMTASLDAEGQRRAKRDLLNFQEEASSKEPRPETLKASGHGLLETAKKVGDIAKPVIELVTLALTLLGHPAPK